MVLYEANFMTVSATGEVRATNRIVKKAAAAIPANALAMFSTVSVFMIYNSRVLSGSLIYLRDALCIGFVFFDTRFS